MRIIVFGASGRTGTLVIKQALKEGCQVTAFVRNPSKMSVRHSSLTIVKGDVLDSEKVDRVMLKIEKE